MFPNKNKSIGNVALGKSLHYRTFVRLFPGTMFGGCTLLQAIIVIRAKEQFNIPQARLSVLQFSNKPKETRDREEGKKTNIF